jgi:hypothetical protein
MTEQNGSRIRDFLLYNTVIYCVVLQNQNFARNDLEHECSSKGRVCRANKVTLPRNLQSVEHDFVRLG